MTTPSGYRGVRAWLWTGAILVAAMVVVGGITRLTGSGLSITEWNLVVGIVPPLNQASWQDLFAKYLATPQGQLVAPQFTLIEFKQIFWWEYLHRLLGRLIGIVFLLPFLWFLFTVRLGPRLFRRLLFILGLGVFQGALGWAMVASGLIDRPTVSHYRLAAHLTTALFTFAVIVWTILDLTDPETTAPPTGHPWLSWVLTLVIGIQIIFGAFTAGLRAGFIYNTWPTMGPTWIPPGLSTLDPIWMNITENPTTVQFIHRSLAIVVLLLAIALVIQLRSDGPPIIRRASTLLLVVIIQFGLGVATILGIPRHPVALGVLHQFGAIAVLTALLMTLHSVRPSLKAPFGGIA